MGLRGNMKMKCSAMVQIVSWILCLHVKRNPRLYLVFTVLLRHKKGLAQNLLPQGRTFLR